MVKTWPAKDPDERLDYTYDWAPDLDEGETLDAAGSTFVAIDAHGTVVVGQPAYGPDFVTVVLEGGDEGTEATYTMRVHTTADRLLEDVVLLPIRSAIVPVPYPGGYVSPTPANLLCVYAEFNTVSAPVIQSYLDGAARSGDETWTEGDFGTARMALAAHLMTLNGLGTSAEASAVADGSAQFRSMAIGSLRLERFDPIKESLASTRYGRDFQSLLRRNRGGPRVTGTAGAHFADGDKAWY
jgi:hypothetical protein